MNHVSTVATLPKPPTRHRPGSHLAPDFADRVLGLARVLGCADAWARSVGRCVILGVGEDEAFARITPLHGDAVGLAFRRPLGEDDRGAALHASSWQPLLLIDELARVVEHALVGEGAIGHGAHLM